MSDAPLFCDRCLTELTPGQGDFYVVSIEAIADPTPPEFSEADLQRDVRAEIERLMEQLSNVTPQEAADEVRRRLTVYLCRPCFHVWIEDPVGEKDRRER